MACRNDEEARKAHILALEARVAWPSTCRSRQRALESYAASLATRLPLRELGAGSIETETTE